MGEQWSREKIWKWYDSRPWMRGCNFLSSDSANFIDIWQEEGFEERLATADRELALAAETGYNTIRVFLEFFVWENQHDGFMERLDRFLDTAWKHGISCMLVFTSDGREPKEWTKPQHFGKQPCDWGYHGAKKLSPHGAHTAMGYHLLDEPELALKHYEYVREIIEAHKDDERVIVWDLYNEPGNRGRGELTMKHLEKFFEIARGIDPIQPLTSCVFRCPADRSRPIYEIERRAVELSDIVSYHNYGTYQDNICIIRRLKEYGRPILNTEWLGRVLHNTVQEMFPLFYLEKIGCYNWGFVAGLMQTYEPWNATWDQYEKNPQLPYDFTKWFHDLYRPSLRPYDPKEIEIIRRYSALADAEFYEKHPDQTKERY